VRRIINAGRIVLALTLATPCAHAQELENLLPDTIPGYGKPFGVSPRAQLHAFDATRLQFGALTAVPDIAVSEGYDSAPNGAAGSAAFNASPSLLLADPILGFGAYAAGDLSNYTQDPSQNASSLTLAAGERANAGANTLILSAGYLRADETGFALDTVAITQPIEFSVRDLRVSDEIALGRFTLKPAASLTRYAFPDFALQNRTDAREALTAGYLPGGPVQLSLRLQATQSDYRIPVFSAETNQVLAGATDTADGLWTLSALAGAAQRVPHAGREITAPVLEAGLDWMPTDFDKVRLELAREIDDPDEVSAAAYTLSQAKLSLDHVFPSNAGFNFTAQISNATFFRSALRETLAGCTATFIWPLGPYLAVNAAYAFNDRQANQLRAANEHIFTLGASWTP
jgi:hypothetical protein